jgi:uncharacterized protein YyaL (SSP411 family)
LLAKRNARIWPGRDEKILTSWNGLAIAGMAVAARVLGRPDFAESATRAVDFIRQHLFRDGRLLAVHKDGQSRFAAYLDDYAFLLDGLIELLQTRWRSSDLQLAVALADALLQHFGDAQSGGFYFTADDHEQLIHRSKSFGDEAVPAGNAIAAQALTRLGLLLGETRYLDAAARTLRAAWAQVQHYPHAHASMLVALAEHLDPPEQVIIRGPREEAASWRDTLTKKYSPMRQVFAIDADAQELPEVLAAKRSLDGCVAYVCRGMTCSEPIKALAPLLALAG